MSMTTPRRSPTWFTAPALPHSLSMLVPPLGTVLRVAIDIASIWTAFLFGWIVVEGRDMSSLVSFESSRSLFLVAFCTILALIVCIGCGLYSRSCRFSLSTKLRRIGGVNVTLFIAVGAVLLLTEQSSVLTFPVLITTVLGSMLLLSLARVVSFILRSEDRALRLEARRASDIPDDHHPLDASDTNVLVIGGGGYIGSALVEKLLNQGFRVSVLDAMHFGDE
ncbi:MAG: NAD-dependent epimerase/dehydratase family protein, partial [Ensifer adhaerens]